MTHIAASSSGARSYWALATILVLTISTSRADVIHVPADYPTIAAAAVAAADGDEIVIAPGTYVESDIDLIGKRVTLRGIAGRDATIIEGVTADDKILLGGRGGVIRDLSIQNLGGVSASAGESVVIQDCAVRNHQSTPVVVRDAALSIRNCEFRDNYWNGAVSFDSDDFDILLESCIFEVNGGADGAVRVQRARRVEILACEFNENWGYGLAGGVIAKSNEVKVADSVFTADFNYSDESHPAGYGGAIHVWSFEDRPAFIELRRCHFEDNGSLAGGAVVCAHDVAIDRCTLEGNYTTYLAKGGAVASYTYGNLKTGNVWITNSRFVNNFSEPDAGAIVFDGQHLGIANSTFIGNSATGEGGALQFLSGESASVDRCFFGSNQAVTGGAIRAQSLPLTISNSVFVANTAADLGGALRSRESAVDIRNCTFLGNIAGADGGAAHIRNTDPPIIRNTIFRASSPNELVNNTPDIAYCNIEGGGFPGAGNIDAAPFFVDADGPDDLLGTEDDDLRLAPGSPGIDAGDNLGIAADTFDADLDCDTLEPAILDLAGNARRYDDPNTPDTGSGDAPVVDMGAYEYDATPAILDDRCPGDFNADGVIDLTDLAILLSHFEQVDSTPHCAGDMNGDRQIDMTDLGMLLAVFGDRCE